MLVVFLKDHLTNSKDDRADLADGLANYLIRVGVAKKEIKTTPKASKK